MSGQDDIEADLARDIGYALSRSALRPKAHAAIDACRAAAGDVVRQLLLAGWRFEKGPGVAAHGTHDGPVIDGQRE